MADTVTTTNNDENLSNVPVLNATPGEINDISEALTQERVDYTSESWVSVQSRVANAALTKNVLQNYGPMVATVLKIIPATTPDPREVKRAAKFDYTPVPLLRIVARVDLMHAHPQFGILPPKKIADDFNSLSKEDKFKIDQHDEFIAKDTLISAMPLKVGDQVWVQYSDTSSKNGKIYLGPRNINIAAFAAILGVQSQCAESSLKADPPKGDDIGSNFRGSFPAGHLGGARLPVVVSGEGHGRVEVIEGAASRTDWYDSAKAIQTEGGLLQGLFYIDGAGPSGKFMGNGPKDNIGLSPGSIYATEPGRQVAIYMPGSCDPAQAIELIYYFHGTKGFRRNGEDFKMIGEQAKAMAAEGRNFAIAAVECLWSEGYMPEGQTESARYTSQQPPKPTNGWTDRAWAMWGYRPPNSAGAKYSIWPEQDFQPIDYIQQNQEVYHKIPGFPMPAGLVDASKVGGNFSQLHGEVLGVLKDVFGVTAERPEVITMVGYSTGGAAIGQAARMGQLAEVAPDKIVFVNGTRSGTPVNGFLDSDLFDVFRLYIADQPNNFVTPKENVVLEVHSSYKDLQPVNERSSKSAHALVGIIRRITQLEENKDKPFKELCEAIVTAVDNGTGIEQALPVTPLIAYGKARATGPPLLVPEDANKNKEAALAIMEEGKAYINPQSDQPAGSPPQGLALQAPFDRIVNVSWGGDNHVELVKKTIKWLVPGVIKQEDNTSDTSGPPSTPGEDYGTWRADEPWTRMLDAPRIHIRDRKNGRGNRAALGSDAGEFVGKKRLIASYAIPPMLPLIQEIADVPGGENEPHGGGWWFGDFTTYGGGLQSHHASHQTGIDFDLSVPVKGGKMGIYGVDPGSSAQAKTFNFRVVQPDELDVESCLYLFKYLAKYCKLVLFDQKLIDICKETAQNEWIPQNKMTEEEYKKIFVSHRIVKHHANHQDHFHIRLKSAGIRDRGGDGKRDSETARIGDFPVPSRSTFVAESPSGNSTSLEGDTTSNSNQTTTRSNGSDPCPPGIGPDGEPTTRNARLPSGSPTGLEPQTSLENYQKHMLAQKTRMKKFMDAMPSLDSLKGQHDGVKSVIVGGETKACPFKVIRYDGTCNKQNGASKDFPRLVTIGGSNGYASKAWWDHTSQQAMSSKDRVGIGKTRGGTNEGWFRKKRHITHFTMHNYGKVDGTFAPGAGFLSSVQKRGFLAHFAIDRKGQIYQITDILYRTSHNAGGGEAPNGTYSTSTNTVSVAVDFLFGVDQKRVPGNSGDTAVLPEVENKFHQRRYNLTWNQPYEASVGTRAAHEACYKLITWLAASPSTSILNRVCYVDGRLGPSDVRKSRIQAHRQLQDGRADGMAYIFWAAAYNKGTLVKADFAQTEVERTVERAAEATVEGVSAAVQGAASAAATLRQGAGAVASFFSSAATDED